MKIVIKNSNNNILLKKRKKKISRLSQTHCSRLGLNLWPSSFLPTYLEQRTRLGFFGHKSGRSWNTKLLKITVIKTISLPNCSTIKCMSSHKYYVSCNCVLIDGWYAEKRSPKNGPLEKKSPEKWFPEKTIPWKMVPGKMSSNLFFVKRLLGNLNDFFIFTDWFHYTHANMFDFHLTIRHAPNRRIIKESRKFCCLSSFWFP